MPAPESEADADASSARVPRPAQLPADLPDFTGRGAQVDHLTTMLVAAGDQPSGAVVAAAIAGAGGIGKSALALHVAHQNVAQFPDGQLYINLRGSGAQPVAATEALARFLRDLGTPPAALPVEESERAARYRSLLSGRRVLVVLDDARDAAHVRSLIPGTAGCAVLVTSRRSLQDLESAHMLELRGLTEADAAELFSKIVGAQRVSREPGEIRAVLAACSGLPLAIRIAGARLAARPAWSIAALASRLRDEHSRLDELEAGDLAVRASFTVSYANLQSDDVSSNERPDRAFRLLGLAEGPDIAIHAGAALLGSPPDQARRVLEALADAHLLEAAAAGRYRLHDLLRVYAAERVRVEETRLATAQAVRRMLRWYLQTAGAACRLVNPLHPHIDLGPPEARVPQLAFEGYDDALAWLDAEQANLLAAVAQAAHVGEHEIAWQLPAVLWDLFDLRGHIGDWLAAHETGLASARGLGDKAAEKRMLGCLAGNYLYLRQPLRALDCVRQILLIARQLGEAGGIAVALVNLGASLTQLGRTSEAMGPMREALALFRGIGERNGEAFALCGIGAIHGQQDDLGEAVASYQQGLVILKEINNLATAAESLVELSALRLKAGHPTDAVLREALEAVDLSRQAGSKRVEAAAMAVLAEAYREDADPDRARRYWHAALAIFTELGHPQAAEVATQLRGLESQDVPAGARVSARQGE